MGYKVWGSLL